MFQLPTSRGIHKEHQIIWSLTPVLQLFGPDQFFGPDQSVGPDQFVRPDQFVGPDQFVDPD